MKRLLALVLIIIVLMGLAACDTLPEGRYGIVPLDGQAVTPGMTYEAQGRVFVIVTPAPSATASAMPVETSTPTSMPTETPLPTPTQESLCMGTVSTSVLNVREGPGTTYAKLPTPVVLGQRLAIEGRSVDGLWYRIYDGWVFAQYITLDAGAICNFPPAQIAGLHLIFSARAGPVLDALRRGAIGSIKGTDGSEAILRAARQQSPGVILIWRNLSRLVYGTRDCPANWGVGDAREVATQWWSAEYATWQQRGLIGVVDFYEYRNECLFMGAWEIAFDLRMVELATNAGVCLALFSDGFGNPEVWQFTQRAPVLDYVLAHPCQPGRYHAIAHHIYHGVEGGTWLFWRWKLFLQALGDPKYLKLVWLITEYGVNEGRPPLDCARFLTDMRGAVKALTGTQVWSLAAYSVGGGTEWVDLDSCLPMLP